MNTIQGLLLVDKPSGWTSFDVVNYVRRIVATLENKKPKNCKVGHTGTLDPLATGLLILLIGKEYTRRAGELTKLDKTYEVTMKLGVSSTTADDEGEKTAVSDIVPTVDAVVAALQKFSGDIMQVPPIFSAMKVNGQRAYKLAREGKAVEMEARPVTIHANVLLDYHYPLVRFTSSVCSGTYVRSLVVDLGIELTTGAYMSDLRRTHIDSYEISHASEVKDLTVDNLSKILLTLPPNESIPIA